MKRLGSYLAGSWHEGQGDPIVLHNPATESPVAELRQAGDLGGALRYAREVGGPALRALSFPQRGALLSRLAKLVHAHREELLDLAMENGGNTRGDAKFDVDGGTAVLAAYAELTGPERETLVDRLHSAAAAVTCSADRSVFRGSSSSA